MLLYNAGSGTWGTVTDITPEQYENDWRVNAYGAFVSAQAVAPDLTESREEVQVEQVWLAVAAAQAVAEAAIRV